MKFLLCPTTNSRSICLVCISAIIIVPFVVPNDTLGLVSSNGDTCCLSNNNNSNNNLFLDTQIEVMAEPIGEIVPVTDSLAPTYLHNQKIKFKTK